MALNSHFVSRFLTQPWEHGQRKLWYYDFAADSLGHKSSRTLFSREDVHSSEFEQAFNRFVETPLSKARAELTASAGTVSPQLEWPLFRALSLLLLLQPFRATESLEGPETLEQTLSRPEKELDGLAHAIGDRYRLIRITVSPQAPLCYPSDGWFPVAGVPAGRACPFGVAIPISERHAFVGVRKSVQPAQTEHWTINGAGYVSNCSVGYRGPRVVVHPAVVGALSQEAIVAAIRSAREGVERGVALCTELATIAQQMDDTCPT
jgi:hypothetical protein